MSPAKIEQIKLTANLLNSLSSGTILASIIAPYIGMALGTMSPVGGLWNIVSLSAFGFVLGLVLHLIARRRLAQIKD